VLRLKRTMLSASVGLHVARRVATQCAARCFSASAIKLSDHPSVAETAIGREYTHPRIGDREIVGWGQTGVENYIDREDKPYPAIRWKEPHAPGVPELRQKELGDWKLMTLEEKKELYRASFCQTLVEYMSNDKGRWKKVLGIVFIGLGVSLWFWFWNQLYCKGNLPNSLDREGMLLRLKYEIASRFNPIQGISSKWDYEKDQWKE